MDKSALIEKMQEVINSLREQLIKNEGSTMSTIGNAAKMGFQSLKASLSGNEAVKMALEAFKQHMEDFEKAIKDGDRQLATKMLDQMESTVQHLKTQTM